MGFYFYPYKEGTDTIMYHKGTLCGDYYIERLVSLLLTCSDKKKSDTFLDILSDTSALLICDKKRMCLLNTMDIIFGIMKDGPIILCSLLNWQKFEAHIYLRTKVIQCVSALMCIAWLVADMHDARWQ